MKFRSMAVFTLLLLAAVVLAFGACSNSSDPTGTSSKGLAFEIDESGNSNHLAGWKDIHQSWNSANASYCGGCHAPDEPNPGCFNNTLCHGADGDDSDEDSVIEANVDRVKQAVSDLLERGLREREGIFT